MTMVPTCPRVAPGLSPSSTQRAGFAGGLRPCLTAPARDAVAPSGRDEETALVSRTKKHDWRGREADDGGQFLLSSRGQFRMSLDSRGHYDIGVPSDMILGGGWLGKLRFSI
jgi:hypothetical protein